MQYINPYNLLDISAINLAEIDGTTVNKAKKKLLEEAPKVLIKTDDKALCKNFIDLIDELYIHEIAVIAPVDMLKSENDLVKEKLK